MNNNKVYDYFNLCRDYWLTTGDRLGVATSKAFWWDCVEVWNADKSWNEEKEEFAWSFRAYKPYDPVPSARVVEEGGV